MSKMEGKESLECGRMQKLPGPLSGPEPQPQITHFTCVTVLSLQLLASEVGAPLDKILDP